ncbi:MAG: hypothetical protein EHM35_14775 [Planctomycetaceae bacterium]|nr:MAG: hypothetical protein EHM35_14775 [Planctomycetaceae bacterium]
MPYETDFDAAFTVLLGKAQGTLAPVGPVITPAPTPTTTTARVVDVAFVLGSMGAPVVVGDHSFIRLGLNAPATIVNWSLAGTVTGASVSGSVAVDLKAGSTLATVVSITGGSPPTLVAQAERREVAPTAGWNETLPDPTWLMASISTTGGTLQVVSLTLRLLVEGSGT